MLNQTRTWIVLLALVHLLLSAGYAKVTPYRAGGILFAQGRVEANDIGAPDERQHANYIGHLASKGSFPVFRPGDPNLYETYQSHQPPLYYALGALWAKATGAGDTSSQSSGLPLRLLNALIGAAGVLGVAKLALWGSKNERMALMAAVFAALLPMNVALSGAISNDPLLICLCAWSMAFAVRMLREGWTLRDGLLAGALAGLALLTKTTALALLPALFLAALLLPAEPLARRLKLGLGVCALALAVALPWLVRNQLLYGDPFAIKAFNEAFVGNPKAADLIARLGFADYWRQNLYATMCSFFGVFGYWEIWLDPWVYQVMGLVLGCFFVGWFLSLRRHPELRAVHAVNGVFLLLVVALFIRFNMQYFQAQGRYLMPALGPIAFGAGCAVEYFSKRRATLVAAGLAALLLGLNAYILRQLPSEFTARVTKPYVP